MDKRNIEATKKSILEAAEKLMTECSDPSEVTSRAITKEANVNLAMINYCFGSRDALLFEVFGKLQTKAQKENPEFIKIITSPGSPKEKLKKIYYQSVRIMLSHFTYTKAITKYALLERKISVERGSLPFIKAHYGERKNEKECLLIAFELSAIHELAVLRHKEIQETCGTDLTDEIQLKKYISDHIDMYLD